ncbi:peptidoglycan/xylan/chitin deacetylase (PgdA/CDA1 family) [Streptacidiphilus sp. EB129]
MAAEPLHQQRAEASVTGAPPSGRPEVDPATAPWTLMYHSVDVYQDDPYQVTVTPERFASQLEWLRRSGLRGVAVGELLRAHAAGRSAGLVGLSFDDGYADLPREVVPLLERYGFSATAFVVADRLGGHNVWDSEGPRKALLTRDQLCRLDPDLIEIGSHGLLHRPLVGLAPDDLAAETGRSRELLEELVGTPVDGFCYPYGAVDREAVAAVRSGGYQYAVAIDHGPLTGRFALPRSFVGERDTDWRLRAKRARHRLRGLAIRLRGAGTTASTSDRSPT